MSPPDTATGDIAFGPQGRFVLRPAERRLLIDGRTAKLGARGFDMLRVLFERRQRIVGKAELLREVWPGLVVEENNLEVHVWALRKLLGSEAITNVPGRGYRFTLVVPGDPLRPAAAGLRTLLPQHLPVLIGRAAELAALGQALSAHRLVTVIGAGGIGKTLLTMHLLEQQHERHPHGVCWVDLAPLAEGSLVAATVATALGVPVGRGDVLPALAAAAAPLSLLLALDNAEAHAQEAAAVVQTLLQACPALHIVVTSQRALGLRAERLFRLGPMALPAADMSTAQALSCGAIALLAQRVRQHDLAFELREQHLAAAASICRALDGNALAIELAAARVLLLGLPGVAAALDQRLLLLSKGSLDGPARQRSLRAALEWSHGLLSSEEQTVFRRLAVFAGGCTLVLMQPVLQPVEAAQDLPRWRLIDALDALVERSLVAFSEGEREGDAPRYRLLESPLALARERLAASGEEAHLRQCHALATFNHFSAALDRQQDARMRADELIALLEPDLDNGRAAMAWALRWQPELALALVCPLYQGLTVNRYSEALLLFERTEGLVAGCADPALQLNWSLIAAIFYGMRHSARARHWALRATDLARQLGDTRSLYRSLGSLAQLRAVVSLDEQRAALAEMAELEHEDWPAGTRMSRAQAQALFAYHAGDVAGIEPLLRRWLMLAQEAGAPSAISAAQTNLADAALVRGDAAEAVRLNRELEARWRDSRRVRALATVRLNLCSALLAHGDCVAAREVAEAGWPMAAAQALQPYWAATLALLAAREGRPRAAALLAGCCEARMGAVGEVLESNEARSLAQACEFALLALGQAAFEAVLAEGALLGDEQLGQVALAVDDSR